MSEHITPSHPRKTRVKRWVIIIAIVVAVLFLAMLVAIPFVVLPMFLGTRIEQEQFAAEDYGIEAERIILETDDGLDLAAWRTRAENNPKGTVILLSGIDNPSVTAFFGYAKMLSDAGWDTLLIEMRARSQSEGDEIGFGMTEWRDVKAGVDMLTADPAVANLPIVAMGTSMGAGVSIIAAGELSEIDAVISLSAFSSWTDTFVDYMTAASAPRWLGDLDRPFVNLYMGLHFGFDALKYTPKNEIAKLGDRPILLMHSTEDSEIPYAEFETLVKAAEKNDIRLTTFVREGDEHFICYEQYFDDPAQDVEFSGAILDFLEVNFP